ncbi:phytanoyl-CoA dioxygenase family protein [Pseudahrensia aquimaris]|uniref:Phytanoyl-CoA dioxygenase family protein n=1 Tax=Pseudahrensia aquimaris TaxID=744461 RepID=A0ABW3FA83_9HYPH
MALPDSNQIEEFQRNGAVLLKGAFVEHVGPMREAIEQNKQNPSWRERTYRPDDGAAPFFQDYVVWNQFDGYRNLVTRSPMAEIAAKLMGSKTARIFHDHVLVKEPGNSVVTPWHQDQPYYLVDATQSVSFWVPLDPVPRDRTIEYIAGSHLWGKDFKPTRFDGTSLFENDTSEAVPDVDALRDELDIIGWAVEPGDAVAFNFRTLHGAPANASPSRRRVVSFRWVGDDARFVERLGTTSPAFPDLEYEAGAPFEADIFPQLYPRP